MLAIIKTGGKQYLIKKGDKIKIEKIAGKVGEKAEFKSVLMIGDEKNVEIGTPILSGKIVEAKILKQDKDKKITIIKHKPKKRYKKKQGHRQMFTEIEITKI